MKRRTKGLWLVGLIALVLVIVVGAASDELLDWYYPSIPAPPVSKFSCSVCPNPPNPTEPPVAKWNPIDHPVGTVVLPPELALARKTYHLLYKDRDLSDQERADVIRFTGDVVANYLWSTKETLPNEGLLDFIARTYNLRADSDPHSVTALVDLIHRENVEILANNDFSKSIFLKIPPVAVHVSTPGRFAGLSANGQQLADSIRVLPLGSSGSDLRLAREEGQLAAVTAFHSRLTKIHKPGTPP